MASVLASFSVKLPEICTCPLNGVNAAWVGWVMGAEMTWPSRSMAMMAWNCCLASVSQAVEPGPVSTRLTVHCPLLSWALADLTAVPVSWAGPSTYRPDPSAAVPGSSTVSFLLSSSGEVDV